MDSETIKAEIIKQVKTQYAMDNARQLIEVCIPLYTHTHTHGPNI